jgi:hypothetical protein
MQLTVYAKDKTRQNLTFLQTCFTISLIHTYRFAFPGGFGRLYFNA